MGSQQKIGDVFRRAGNLFVKWFDDFVSASCSLVFNSSYFYSLIALKSTRVQSLNLLINAEMLGKGKTLLEANRYRGVYSSVVFERLQIQTKKETVIYSGQCSVTLSSSFLYFLRPSTKEEVKFRKPPKSNITEGWSLNLTVVNLIDVLLVGFSQVFFLVAVELFQCSLTDKHLIPTFCIPVLHFST